MTLFTLFALIILVFWLLGTFVHFFKRADMKQDSPSFFKAPFIALCAFFRDNQKAVVVRTFLSLLGILMWIEYPDMIQQGFVAVAGQLSDGLMKSILITVKLPLNPVTAALYGFLADSLLDWATAKVPALRKEIPDYSENT